MTKEKRRFIKKAPSSQVVPTREQLDTIRLAYQQNGLSAAPMRISLNHIHDLDSESL